MIFALSACGNSSGNKDSNLKIVVTNSILYDMAKEVGKDHVDIHSIVPIGTDPHEYEPLPTDAKSVSKADLIFYNGLNLEVGNGWFKKMIDSAGRSGDYNKNIFAVSKGVTPIHLKSEGQENQLDPHAWLDIQNGIKYIRNMEKQMAKKDPDHAEDYHKNADAYVEKLEDLDKEAKEKMAAIPDEQSYLITSEGAFKYFSRAYGLHPEYIWEINTEEQGTPDQMKRIIGIIKKHKVPHLFVETSVNPKSMETLSKETGIKIYSKIFTDSLAKKGKPGDTYYDMIKWNLDHISEGLSK
ncbi:metal ABC transporter substrate-binding protein [Sporolactobacillus shoreicorticis]|uniref:Metal ABC transporter substrate-binding protein n=1 Tax=Sporolactobacillus shoreicorticis TaxID=1923877 RepID=A0ABW5S3V7_9BACL|nr:metal ABC transporter substrate-binding protein [Sporolactobacillus shoreicorticis]MCO7128289.1 metal ABC transporter substrate-binding protein [Sporolactobacillus shoreicorticis]